MHPFAYARAARPEDAIATVAPDPGAAFFAGGTTLLDLMKLDVVSPTRLVDVNALPLAAIEPIAGGLRIGSMARMSDVAVHPEVVRASRSSPRPCSTAPRPNSETWRPSVATCFNEPDARTSGIRRRGVISGNPVRDATRSTA